MQKKTKNTLFSVFKKAPAWKSWRAVIPPGVSGRVNPQNIDIRSLFLKQLTFQASIYVLNAPTAIGHFTMQNYVGYIYNQLINWKITFPPASKPFSNVETRNLFPHPQTWQSQRLSSNSPPKHVQYNSPTKWHQVWDGYSSTCGAELRPAVKTRVNLFNVILYQGVPQGSILTQLLFNN